MEKTNFDDSSLPTFLNKLKRSIFISYYNIISRQLKMNIVFIITLLINGLQIIGLLLFHISNSNTDFPAYFNIQDFLSLVKLLLLFYPSKNFIYANVMLYIIFTIFSIQFIIFLYYFFKKDHKILNVKVINSKKKILYEIFFSTILVINLFQLTIFIIPFFITLFSFIECTSINGISYMINFPMIQCYTAQYYINIIICSISIFFYLLILILNSMFLNDESPISILPTSGSTPLSILLRILLNTTLSFCFVFNFNLIFIFKFFLMNIFIILLIVNKIVSPFFHQKIVFKFTVFLEGSFIFNSIISVLNYYLNTIYNNKIIIIQLLTSFVFGLLIVNIIEKLLFYYTYRKVHFFFK